MKYFTLITFLFLFFSTAATAQVHEVEGLDYLESKRSFLVFHENLARFFLEVDSTQEYPSGDIQEGQGVVLKKLYNLLLKEAYAANPSNLCYFGGWPSLKVKGVCRAPWKHAKNPIVSALKPTYSPDQYCGPKNSFRCNPLIFGAGPGNDGKGQCITFKSIRDVSKICHKASKRKFGAIFDKLKTDDKYAQNYRKMIGSVVEFCLKNEGYSACEFLMSSVAKQLTAACDRGLTPFDMLNSRSIVQLVNFFLKTKNETAAQAKKRVQLERKKTTVAPKKKAAKAKKPKPKKPKPKKTKKSKKRSRKLLPIGGPVKTRLPDRGDGYYTKYVNGRANFGTAGVIQRIQMAGKALKKQGITASITEISRKGGTTPGHKEHQGGKDVDLRFVDKHGNARQCTIYQKCFDRKKTFQMVKAFIDADPRSIDAIWVGDKKLQNMINSYLKKRHGRNRITRYSSKTGKAYKEHLCAGRKGHHDHIHLSWGR